MTQKDDQSDSSITDSPTGQGKTISEMLFYLEDRIRRRELEEFRVQFEAVHGETDLTRRYTSLWSTEQQEQLFLQNPKRYFDGLPPFVQEYLRSILKSAQRDGRLDSLSDNFIRLAIKGRINNDHGFER